MDIILIQSPCWGLYAPPLALASLSAFLRNKGLSVAVMDLNIDMFYRCKEEYKRFWDEAEHEFWRNEALVEKFYLDNKELFDDYLKKIGSHNSRFVGFSVYDTSLHLSLLLAKKIKEFIPEIIIVFGGPHCSRFMCKDFILSHECVDVLIEGEGEEPLFDVINMLIRDGEFGYCPGTVIRKGSRLIDGAERPLIDNLDVLPFPDFSDFPVGSYKRNDALPVSTSRGCINRCVFCNEWLFWRRFRFKTGNYIFQEVKHQLSKYPHIKNIEFYDSLVNGNLREINILCDLLIQERVKIRWSGQAVIRPDMDQSSLSKFRKSGCGCLAYGLESGSQNVLDTIRKGFRVADAERVIRETYEAGIDVVLNVMFGLPGEKENDFEETLNFIARNKEYITILNPSPSFCGIAPGTYLYSHSEEFDISTPIESGLFWKTNDNSNNYLVRLKRFEKFCEFVQLAGVKSTYPAVELINKNKIIGDYYLYNRNYSEALKYYQISAEKEGIDSKIKRLMDDCQIQLTKNSPKTWNM